MATIYDISKKTGYSESTVASILRGASNFRVNDLKIAAYKQAAKAQMRCVRWIKRFLSKLFKGERMVDDCDFCTSV